MIGEHEGRAVGPLDLLASHLRQRAVGADDEFRAQGLFALAALRFEMNDDSPVGLARQALVAAIDAGGAGFGGALAQPFVEFGSIDHADIAAVNRHVDAGALRRNHRGQRNASLQQIAGNREVTHGARGDCATAWLDTARLVEKRHLAADPRQIIGGGGARRPAADHDDVIDFLTPHVRLLQALWPRSKLRAPALARLPRGAPRSPPKPRKRRLRL